MADYPYAEAPTKIVTPITFGAHPGEWPHPRHGQSCAQLAASIKSPPTLSHYCETINDAKLLVLEETVHTVVVTEAVRDAQGDDVACKFSDVSVTTKIHTGKPCPGADYKPTLADWAVEEALVRAREAAAMAALKAAIRAQAAPQGGR